VPTDKHGAHETTLDVVPISKGRARITKYGHYTPPRTALCEQQYAEAYDGPLFEGPVKVELVFHADKVRMLIVPMADDWVKTPRGDVDNLIKTVGDGLNGVAWKDDKQIKWIDARKARKEET
jgi:Holliday junction resolvase RusA-like endonuclease